MLGKFSNAWKVMKKKKKQKKKFATTLIEATAAQMSWIQFRWIINDHLVRLDDALLFIYQRYFLFRHSVEFITTMEFILIKCFAGSNHVFARILTKSITRNEKLSQPISSRICEQNGSQPIDCLHKMNHIRIVNEIFTWIDKLCKIARMTGVIFITQLD